MDRNIDLIFELFEGLPRGGPGSQETTRKAFGILPDVPSKAKILDIGCGPGVQTIELAKLTDGPVVALDIYQPFLDSLSESAKKYGVSDKIQIINQSMTEMDFEKESFDIIWAEGSIFIMGFEKGLEAWHYFLKNKGYVAVSELVWLVANPPKEIRDFYTAAYPGMQTHKDNLRVIEKVGYKNIDSFVLPGQDWLNLHNSMEQKIKAMRAKYIGDDAVTKFLDLENTYIHLFRKYPQTCGYIFYIMQKIQ